MERIKNILTPRAAGEAICLLAGLLLSVSSCQKQPSAQEQPEPDTFAARITAGTGGGSSDETKASVTEDNGDLASGESFRWDAGDRFSLVIAPFGATGIASWNTFTMDDATLSANKKSADFTGSINSGSTSDVLYGLYPQSAYGTSINAVTLTMPTTFTQTNNPSTFATSTAHLKEGMLMYAHAALTGDVASEDAAKTVDLPSLSFHHLCPLVRFRVRNATTVGWKVTKIELAVKENATNDNKSTYFANGGTLDLTSDAPAIVPSAFASSLTLNIVNSPVLPQSTSFAAGNHLNAYLPLLPTNKYASDYSGDDYLSIKVTMEDTTLEYKVPVKSFDIIKNGLQSGLRYYFNITIDNELRLEGVSVDDWFESNLGNYDTEK